MEQAGMSKRVFRTDLRHRPVSEALACVDAGDLAYLPTAITVEEGVHMLLGHDEICLGRDDLREIRQGARIVGYIRIIDLSGR
jgi:hypothetical protein